MADGDHFEQLSGHDGSWARFITNWETQFEKFGEEMSSYVILRDLQKLAEEGHPKAGVFALKDGSEYAAVCQANCTLLPGYDGPVLRLRFITVSPNYDFGEFTIDEYGTLLVQLLVAALNLSEDQMPARHLKFHLQSPADRQFFAAFSSRLAGLKEFESVAMKGAWLYITKA